MHETTHEQSGRIEPLGWLRMGLLVGRGPVRLIVGGDNAVVISVNADRPSVPVRGGRLFLCAAGGTASGTPADRPQPSPLRVLLHWLAAPGVSQQSAHAELRRYC